jgi:hypothetical protein
MSNSARDASHVQPADFPAAGTDAEKLRFLVRYAVLAPSSHNTQPWLFKPGDDCLELYADRTRSLPVVDPADRALTMSCGAALFCLRLGLRHFGYAGEIQVLPEPGDADLLARVRLGEPRQPHAEDEALFQAIRLRHTHRLPFEDRPLEERLLKALQQVAAAEGALLCPVSGDAQRAAVAELVVEGDEIQMADPVFRRELAAWLRPNQSGEGDGIPGYAFGFNSLTSLLIPPLVRTLDLGRQQSGKDRELVLAAPALAVLVTEADAPRHWLSSGQALAHVLLRGTMEGAAASFLNQAVEVPELRPRLAATLGVGGYPQLLFRLGYATPVLPTPRRGAAEVLIR